MIPYFIWNAVMIIRHQNFSFVGIITQLFVTTPIWFLINLFYFDFSVYLAHKFIYKKEIVSFIIMGLFYAVIVSVYSFTEAELLKYTVLFYPYFFDF